MGKGKIFGSTFIKVIAALFICAEDTLAQAYDHANSPETVQCLNDLYRKDLESSFEKRRDRIANSLAGRTNNGDFEIHFFIDTSYERRRTGGYNNNNQVSVYMANLANQVVGKFNVAAPNWDVNSALTISFFDGATPFSYGNNIVETIENFLDWLIANNFPGDDDVYVFYTGQYTNIGVTYLGTLCWPGVSLTSFVNSQIPNESLSSHEWMGHINNAVHYDNEANIMKSTNATFPWHGSSLADAEDLLESAGCVENVQSPLSLEYISTEFNCNDQGNVNLSIQLTAHRQGSAIRIMHGEDGRQWNLLKEITMIADKKDYWLEFERDEIADYIKLIHLDEFNREDQSDVYKVPECGPVKWHVFGDVLINPENQAIRIFDMTGRLLKETREPELKLETNAASGMLILSDGLNHVRAWCP